MPIDPLKFSVKLDDQREHIQRRIQDRQSNLQAALAAYQECNPQTWHELATSTQTNYNLAYLARSGPQASLLEKAAVQPGPKAYTVVATDSSPMPPDRHGGMAAFHLINLGLVMLRYGPDAEAALENRPLVYFDMLDEEGGEADAAQLIDMRGSVEELRSGLELARQHRADLVLRDGPLSLWTTAQDMGEGGKSLRDEYFFLLEKQKAEGIPLIGYISSAHSQVVFNTLNLYLEELPPSLWDGLGDNLAPVASGAAKARPKKAKSKTPGGVFARAGLVDADLFRLLLQPGERGPIFKTAIGRKPGEAHKQVLETCFTYYHTPFSGEIARIEFGEWLLDEPGLLDKALGLVHNQYYAGQGYPVALMEAHEQAVLRGGDRALIRDMLELEGLLEEESEKGRSKRLRGL
jgi:hypothetical protein